MTKLSDYEYLILDLVRAHPKTAGFFHDYDLPLLERMETVHLISFQGGRWHLTATGAHVLEHELDTGGQ